jgi:DNA-directed RNA polymerase specialized sigma24 family protein
VGDEAAVEQIFDRFFPQTVQLARRNLRQSRRRAADEEDVALEALASFFRGAANGRFPDLRDRRHLWHLLATITIRKAAAQVRREQRDKRGKGLVRGESVFWAEGQRCAAGGLAAAQGPDATPELIALLAENCEGLLDRLPDDTLRAVAIYKLQGFTHREIAEKIGRAEETVHRKLRRIREIWLEESIE